MTLCEVFICKMSVDKFGRSAFYLQKKHGFFEMTNEDEEVINAKKRRITNVETPLEKDDATNKSYVDKIASDVKVITTDVNDIHDKLSTLTRENKNEISKLVNEEINTSLNKCMTETKSKLFEIFKTYYKTSDTGEIKSLEEESLIPTQPVTIKELKDIYAIWLMNN